MICSEIAKQHFLDGVIQIPGIVNVRVVPDTHGNETIYVLVPDIFRGAAWEVTRLKCQVEDEFPTVDLLVEIEGLPQDQSDDTQPSQLYSMSL